MMSRIHTMGINPDTGDIVDVAFGWDQVPGFKPGYFLQVYSRTPIEKDETGEGMIVNEGFLEGLETSELLALFDKWGVKAHELGKIIGP